jgi:hypothetical protein
MSWKILLSGYVPNYLYELGRLDTTKPFVELERISRVKRILIVTSMGHSRIATRSARGGGLR